MGLFDFLKSWKDKLTPNSKKEDEQLLNPGDVDPAEINPPETRFTQEYKEFLASQEEKMGKRQSPSDCDGEGVCGSEGVCDSEDISNGEDDIVKENINGNDDDIAGEDGIDTVE